MIARCGLAGLTGVMALLLGCSSTAPHALNDVEGHRVSDAAEPAIRGSVTDREGKAIAGARVRAYWPAWGRRYGIWSQRQVMPLGSVMAEATTGVDGRFTLAGARLAKLSLWGIVVTADGYAPAAESFVAPGATGVQFQLRPGPTLAGKVVARDGSPVAGAKVDACKYSMFEGTLDTAAASPDGTFRLATLGDGSTLLRVSAPGYQTSQGVEVLEGTEVKVSTITLDPGSVLRGVVKDAEGAGVEGASVRAWLNELDMMEPNGWSGDHGPEETRTGKDGTFVFDTLHPGVTKGLYSVSVTHPVLASAERKNVTSENLQITLTRGAVLTGCVRNAKHEGICGATVEVYGEGGREREAVTDRDGCYRIVGLRAGPGETKHVDVTCPGYIRELTKQVDFSLESEVTHDVVLRRAARLAGTVLDPSGRPLPDARVALEGPKGVTLGCGERTDGLGRFDIREIEPGGPPRYLVVTHPNYVRWESAQFELVDGEALDGLDVILDLGPARVHGTAIDEREQPLAGVRVVALSPGESRVTYAERPFADTDVFGRFVLGNLRAKDYQLVAYKDGYLETRSAAFACDGKSPAPDVGLVLARGAFVAGTVRRVDGKPLANVEVVVTDSSAGVKRLSVFTDARGAFRVDALGPEPVDVEARADGFAPSTREGVASGTTDVALVLKPYGAITGRVLDRSGAPVEGANVVAEAVQVEPAWDAPRFYTKDRVFDAASGTFRFRHLPPGTYTVSAAAGGASIIVTGVRVTEGVDTDVGAIVVGEGEQEAR